jgi:hypothetical protein
VPCTRRRNTVGRATAVGLPVMVWTGGVLTLEQRRAVTPPGALLIEGQCAHRRGGTGGLRLAGRTEPVETAASISAPRCSPR